MQILKKCLGGCINWCSAQGGGKGIGREEKGKEGRGKEGERHTYQPQANFVQLEHWMHLKWSPALVSISIQASSHSSARVVQNQIGVDIYTSSGLPFLFPSLPPSIPFFPLPLHAVVELSYSNELFHSLSETHLYIYAATVETGVNF